MEKTKEELLQELEQKNNEIKSLKQFLKDLKNKDRKLNTLQDLKEELESRLMQSEQTQTKRLYFKPYRIKDYIECLGKNILKEEE